MEENNNLQPTEEPAPAPQPVVSEQPAPAPQPTVSEQPTPASQPTVSEQPTLAPQPTASAQPAPAPQPTVSAAPLPTMLGATPPYHGFAIASLVLGIVSIVCCCCSWVMLPAAITGLVLGIVARCQGNKETVSLVGVILSAVAVGLILLVGVVAAAYWMAAPEILQELTEEFGSTPYDWDADNMLAFFRW